MGRRSSRWPKVAPCMAEKWERARLRRSVQESQESAMVAMATGQCSERFPVLGYFDGEQEWRGELQPDGSTKWSVFEGP